MEGLAKLSMNFKRYQSWDIKKKYNNCHEPLQKNDKNVVDQSPLTPNPQIIMLPDKKQKNNKKEIVIAFSNSVDCFPNRNQTSRNVFSRERLSEMNKKCKQLRDKNNQNKINFEPLINRNETPIFQASPSIHTRKHLRSSFACSRETEKIQTKPKPRHGSFQDIITTLSCVPSHHKLHKNLVKELSSFPEKAQQRQKIKNNSIYRGSMKPKSMSDNPRLLVGILKRKSLNMETQDIHKYLVRLARKLNA